MNWDSSVGTVTGLWTTCLKSRGSVPGMGTKLFCPPERPARLCGPPRLLFSGYFGLFTGGGLAERSEVDHFHQYQCWECGELHLHSHMHFTTNAGTNFRSSRAVPSVFCARASCCTAPPHSHFRYYINTWQCFNTDMHRVYMCVCACIYIYVYRVSQEECARLREGVPYVKVYQYNPKQLCPKLNGYGDNGQRSLKLWQLLHNYWLPNTY